MNNTILDNRPAGNQGIVKLEGSLTVSQAEELRMRLIKTIIDVDQVRVEFGSVSEVDLSCLQLLCSAHRSATRMSKRLFLSKNWPEPFKKAVEDSGYSRHTGCRLDSDRSCLWVKR
jgi:anti-anti-sigma regulatory factor